MTYNPRYAKQYSLDRHRGVPRHPVPREQVQAHLRALVDAGWSQRHIAEVAACAPTTVTQILRGDNAHVQRDLASRLLALELSTTRTARRGFVPKQGTIRRIQALLALGWTHEQLHQRSGVHTHVVQSQAGRWVSSIKHDTIAQLYDQLSMTPGPSERTRSRAAALGYLPPLAWDDDTIDDPNAQPHSPARETRRDARVHVDDVEWLITHGQTRTAIAARLGVTENAINRALHRAGRYDLTARLTRLEQGAA